MAENSFDLSQEAEAFLTSLSSVVSSPVQLGQLLAQFGVALEPEKLKLLATQLAGLLPNLDDSISAGALWQSYHGLQAQLQTKLTDAGVPDNLTARLLPVVFSRFTEARHPALYALAALLGVVALEPEGGATPAWSVARAWAALTGPRHFTGKDLIPGAADLLSALGLPVTLNFAEGDVPVFSVFLGEGAGFRMAWSDTPGLMIAPFNMDHAGAFETDGWKLEWAFPPGVTALSIHLTNGLQTEPQGANWTGASLKATHVDSGISLTAEITADRKMILTLGIGAHNMNLMQGLDVEWRALSISYNVAAGVSNLAVDDLVLKAESLNKFWGRDTETRLSLNIAFKEGSVADSSFLEFKTPALGGWTLSEFQRQDSRLKLAFPADVLGRLLGSLGLSAASDALVTLSVGANADGNLSATLSAAMTTLAVNLGSPLARLRLDTPVTFSMSTEGGMTLDHLPPQLKGAVELDLFGKLDDKVVVNSIWGPEASGLLLQLPFEFPPAQPLAPVQPAAQEPVAVAAGDTLPPIRWKDGVPQIQAKLLTEILGAVPATTSGKKSLLSLSGPVPVAGEPMKVTFDQGGKPQLKGDKLAIPLQITILAKEEELLKAAGELMVDIGVADDKGYLAFAPGAFALSNGEATLTVTDPQGFSKSLGNLLTLTIPSGSVFNLSLDPKNPELAWKPDLSRATTDARITLSVPAKADNGQFTFEMESFRIHSAGIDLRGAVRTDSVTLGGAAFKGPVGVKSVQRNGQKPTSGGSPRPHQIGEIEFKNSRLVYGSLQASAKLPYFDDAAGTLTLFLSQGEDQSLACAGTLDISGIDEFHIDDLFITVQVDHLQLGVKYDSQWSSKASLTGRVKFQPPQGRSANEMGMLSSLFAGVVLDFEDLDPLAGKGAWKLTTPPKRFNIADILLVDLRGVTIGLTGEGDNRTIKECQLLGDITVQELPGIDASLTFGGITLTPGSKPEIKIAKIAAQFSAPGGFSMSGEMEDISTEQETGFAGGFTLKMSALPELGGILKLTRVRLTNGKVAPSLALFVEYAAEVPLLYGFYLRRLGIGLGVRQALRGLEPDSPIPADQRLVRFIDNPAGLPDPIFANSWRPVQRPQLSWMLVGAGLITFGNLGNADPHLIAGSFLLSLDQDLRLILGTNLWLFTTPDGTRNAEFLQRPVARGGMELSVGDGYLKTYLRTIKGPKLGKKAPPLLADVLNAVETSFFFQVDRNGFITEVGWPWETRITYDIDEYFHGELQAGFRYGFYRGVLIFGLNFAIAIRIEASQTLSFGVMGVTAEVGLQVRGAASFRASFVGALDAKDLRGYLLGDVRLDAMVSVTASASVRIKIGFIKIRIRFSATLSVSISAALTAAMTSTPEIGFKGEAHVAISVCGYGISGSVAFKYKDGVIDQVQKELTELLPPAMVQAQQSELALAAAAEPPPPLWHYRFRWMDEPDEPGKARLRILLFPSVETPYPLAGPHNQFSLTPKDGVEFAGFVGSTDLPNVNVSLIWTQDLARSLDLGRMADFEQEGRAYLEERLVELVGLPTNKPANFWRASLEERLVELRSKTNLTDEEMQKLEGILKALEDVKGALENNKPETTKGSAYLKERLDELRSKTNLTDEEMQELEGILKALEDVKGALENNKPETTIKQYLEGLHGNPPTGNPPTGGHPLNGTVSDQRVDTDYDSKLAKASKNGDQPDQQLGLVLAELLALMKDERAKPGTNANQTRTSGEPYRMAHLLNLVLEFSVRAEWRQRRDPVPDLINLDAFTVADQETQLESVLGRNAPPVEYDLIPGPVHQEPGRICLTWDFLREDEAQGSRQGAGSAHFAPYAELERYIVTRFNVNRPGDRPRVVATQPAWIILEQDGSPFYLRPLYQFIDDDLENVSELNLIQYRVEAHAPDRLLASTLINVTRKTEKPLPIVGQTLAFHHVPETGAQTLTFVVPAWDFEKGDTEEQATGRATRASKEQEQAAELKIQYRLAPAARFGAYGYDLRPVSPMRWVDGLPARRSDDDFPKLKFTESSEGRPMPWEETESLAAEAWKPITAVRYDSDADGMVVEVIGFECEVKLENWPEQGSDQAVEFYIGRLKPRRGNEPEERSPLTRCRHAVAAAKPGPLRHGHNASPSWLRYDDTQDRYTLDLSAGNTVDAFEVLKVQRNAREFLDPAQIQLTAEYPEPQLVEITAQQNGEAPKQEVIQPPPAIELTWRHDRTISAAKGDDPFNPVIGYRIHCFDRYDPSEYPALSKDGVVDRTLVTVRAIPERLYRATPESIVVEGVPIGTPDESAMTVDQKVQRMLEEAKTGKFRANWAEIEQVQLASSPKSTIPQLDPLPSGGFLLWEAAPIYLSSDLVVVLTNLCKQLGDNVRCRLIIHQPLEQRFRVEEVTAAALRSLVENLTVQFSERSDPFGWSFAEALGMSCECHFLDADDVPIPAEKVRDTIVAHELGAPATVCFFRAADDRTLLNVVRLIGGTADAAAHKRALVCHLTAKPPKVDNVNPDPLENWPTDAETKWPQGLNLDWQAEPSVEGTVYLPQRVKRDATPLAIEYRHDIRSSLDTSAPVASVELPIAADGAITYRWQAPDLWSHRYGVAVELIRRHDALWRLLRSANEAEPTAIPATHLKEIIVDRTRALVPHNLIVTPLPGSIQALVFRHPAAFAAAASAVNATHGQYAGQTVILERRIDARNKLVKDYYQPFDIGWEQYRPHQLADEDVPSIWHQSADAATLPLALQPVSGTEPGIYGADRYVYPDLPGYYQYRVAVYSAAGRAQSPTEVSGWVDPIYDQERQPPKAMRPQDVVFDPQGKRLTMKLPVVHAAHHLRPEMRALWRAADEVIPELDGKLFGDLPDLYLTYQLYIRTNTLIPETTAVYVPLCRLVGPMARPQPANGQDVGPGFKLENQTPGANITTATTLEADGLLFWSMDAALQGALDPSLLAGLTTAPERAAEFIAVAVQRRGVWSKPPFDAPTQGAAPQP